MFTIFLAPKHGENFSQKKFEEFVSHSLVEAGIAPELLSPAVAVIPDNGNVLKTNGIVVAFNEKEPCLKAAFILKPYLRLEAYTVPLNEALPLNCFRAIVHMRSYTDAADICHMLIQSADFEPVTIVFFEYMYGTLAFGAIRQLEGEDIDTWKSNVKKICAKMDLTSVIFEVR